jgi:Na+/melibiose symporter-like transporter
VNHFDTFGVIFMHLVNVVTTGFYKNREKVCLQEVVGLSKLYAGFLLTIGQLTDGIATPLVGIGLDKVGLCGKKYGKRKSWHMFGTLLITFT